MNIRELRKNRGLRTVDVASVVGVAESTVRNWEYGKTIPKLRIDQIKKLIDLYKCDFNDLYNAVLQTNDN